MAHFVELAANGAGEYVDTFQMSDGTQNVDRQAVVIGDDATYAARAKVSNAEPASTDYGLSIRRVCGGCSFDSFISAASTNAANTKASAGRVTGWTIYNNALYTIYVKLHDTAGTPTAGSGVVYTIAVPAGGCRDFDDDDGIAFLTGIGRTVVKGIALTDATAVALSDCAVNLHYK